MLDADWLRRLRSTVEPIDGTRLKRVGVATYFGVYVLIAVGGWRALVALSQLLPPLVRPPAFPPLHVLFGLPRSLAWGFVSLSVALVAVGILAVIHVARARADRPRSLDDLGDTSLLDRLRSGIDGVEAAVRALPVRHGADDEGVTAPDVTVVDGSLDPPSDALSLPRPADALRQSLGVVASDHLPDVSVRTIDVAVETTDAEILDDEDEAASGPRSDGGIAASESDPDPDAPWPEEPDSAAEEDTFDEDAPWPGDWIAGDEL